MEIIDTLTGAITTDMLVIAVVFVAFAAHSLVYGKSRSVALLMSLYVGILVFLSFPYLEEVTFLKSSEVQITLSHIALFVLGVGVIYTIVSRAILVEYPHGKLGKYFHIALLSLSSTGLLFAFAYHTLPIGTLYNFDASINTLFSSQYFFWWLIAPLVALFITTRG